MDIALDFLVFIGVVLSLLGGYMLIYGVAIWWATRCH